MQIRLIQGWSKWGPALLFFICGLVYIPFLLNKGLYWDDWAWYWVYWIEGADQIIKILLDVHPGYGPSLAFVYAVGGEYVGVLARTIAVAAHIGSSMLIYVILRDSQPTHEIALWSAVIYLLSPFYYARVMVAHHMIDVFMLCYLLSIWLMGSKRRWVRALSIVTFVMSFSFEVLLFLEPLRLFIAYCQQQGEIRKVARQMAPFWVLGGVFAILRITVLVPSGDFADYNQINFAIQPFIQAMVTTYQYYLIDGLQFIAKTTSNALRTGPYFFTIIELSRWPIELSIVGLSMVWFVYKLGRLPKLDISDHIDVAGKRLLLGMALTISGAVPYALINSPPNISPFASRLSFVSVIGIAIVTSTLIKAIPWRFIRYGVLGFALFVMVVMSLAVTKVHLYDSLIQRSLLMQVNRALAAAPETEPLPRFRVTFVPHSLALGRSLSVHELTVPLNLMNNPENPSIFIYDNQHFVYGGMDFPDKDCVVFRVFYPCPDRLVNLEYVLNNQYGSVNSISYLTLLKDTLTATEQLPPIGTLRSPSGWSVDTTIPAPAPQSHAGLVTARLLQFTVSEMSP